MAVADAALVHAYDLVGFAVRSLAGQTGACICAASPRSNVGYARGQGVDRRRTVLDVQRDATPVPVDPRPEPLPGVERANLCERWPEAGRLVFLARCGESCGGPRGKSDIQSAVHDAQMLLARDEAGVIYYQSKSTHRGEASADYDASYSQAGAFFEAEPGSLEHWLTARYCLYSANRKGRIIRGEIDHPPWSLAPATYTERTNTMGDLFGFDFQPKPHLLFAKPVDVRAWLVTKCS